LKHDSITVRNATVDDLPHLTRIQSACYPTEYLEATGTFERKLQLSPDSHWLIECDGVAMGYFLTHPWAGNAPPALDHATLTLPEQADCHFLHDLALHPAARGQGLAPRLIEAALQWGRAHGLPRTMLVAVQGSVPFWERWGFACIGNAAAYGDGAALMQRADALSG
jgi:GNAT superfamily N-acetyltransferase